MKKLLLIALAISSTAFSSVSVKNDGSTYTVDQFGAVKKVTMDVDALKAKRSTSFEIIRKLDK